MDKIIKSVNFGSISKTLATTKNKIVFHKFTTINITPVKYNKPPILRVIYIGTICVTVSKNWYLI